MSAATASAACGFILAMTLAVCLQSARSFGGSVLVEQVFSYPGLGQAAVTAGLGNDVPLLLGITVVTAVLAASGNLAASVLYESWIPGSGKERPDERYEEKRKRGKRLGNRRLFSDGIVWGVGPVPAPGGRFWVCMAGCGIGHGFFKEEPSSRAGYLFGTDWMGRDMFVRTVAGLSMSIRLGLLTAAVSAVIAFLLGASAAVLGRAVDGLVTLLIDLVMGIPHMLLLILVPPLPAERASGA